MLNLTWNNKLEDAELYGKDAYQVTVNPDTDEYSLRWRGDVKVSGDEDDMTVAVNRAIKNNK